MLGESDWFKNDGGGGRGSCEGALSQFRGAVESGYIGIADGFGMSVRDGDEMVMVAREVL